MFFTSGLSIKYITTNHDYFLNYFYGTYFSSPSYYVWGTLVIVLILGFRFLVDLHVWGSGEFKKHKISMDPGVR